MHKRAEDIVKEYLENFSAGQRAGHRGFFRKEKSGAIKFHPQTGIHPEVREKVSLERKLEKRRMKKGAKGKKKEKQKIVKKGKKKLRGELSGTMEETDPIKKKAAMIVAEHSLRRAFKG